MVRKPSLYSANNIDKKTSKSITKTSINHKVNLIYILNKYYKSIYKYGDICMGVCDYVVCVTFLYF